MGFSLSVPHGASLFASFLRDLFICGMPHVNARSSNEVLMGSPSLPPQAGLAHPGIRCLLSSKIFAQTIPLTRDLFLTSGWSTLLQAHVHRISQ